MQKKRKDLHAPFGPLGKLFSESATGTVPVLSIFSSRASCSSLSRSACSSSSSTGSVRGIDVMALPISCVSSCCSRSCSLKTRCQLCLAFDATQRKKRSDGSEYRSGGIVMRVRRAYIVTSTSSIVIFPCICFIAAPAFFIATSVS